MRNFNVISYDYYRQARQGPGSQKKSSFKPSSKRLLSWVDLLFVTVITAIILSAAFALAGASQRIIDPFPMTFVP